MAEQYEDRLRRVIQYIFDNPAGDLSLDALADIAAMSRFHWHRVFVAMTGETCAQAVRRVRASRASHDLVQADLSMDQIAQACGYDNRQSFDRLFRKQFGISPAAFRKAGQLGVAEFILRQGNEAMFDVTIKDLPSQRLAGMPHKGAYMEIGQVFEQLAVIASTRGLWPEICGMVGVYYDDPDAVAEKDLNSFAGLILPAPVKMPDDCKELSLAAGPHAVLTFKGPYSGLRAAYQYLFGAWLAASGREPASEPAYEVYLNNPREVPPEELLTQICLPLKS